MEEKLTTRQRKERARRIRDLQEVCRLDAGRRFVMDLLGDYGVYRNSFAEQPQLAAFNAGMQNAGQALLSRLEEVDLTLYPSMLLERAQEMRNTGNDPVEEDEDDDY